MANDAADGSAVLETVHADKTLRIAIHGRVIMCVWRGPPSVPQLDALGSAGRALASRITGKSVTMNMMVEGNPRFSEEARLKSSQVGREAEAYSAGVAHVVLLPGLAGVTTRTFLSTVGLLTGRARPMKVFGSLTEAVAWVVELCGPDGGVTREGLEAAARAAMVAGREN